MTALAGSDYILSQLEALEAESIHIFREVAAEMERPCLLFSGGKDSVVMSVLARKAFAPARIPFPMMHIDTGLNFPQVLAFRDAWVEELEVRLVVASVEDAIKRGLVREESNGSRNRIQTPVLLEAVEQHRFDALFGGARRDEEKARAKERVFSFRDEFGQWDPKNQRPELWNLFNGKKRIGEHMRVFPISNWTEMDVWQYIFLEKLDLPSPYFTHKRRCIRRNGVLLAESDCVAPRQGEEAAEYEVRFRTVGDMTCTGAILSRATELEEIILEVASSRITERGGRADDKRSEAAMEDRKKEGYF